MSRKESRGLHYTLDYPELDHALDGINTILTPQRHQIVSPGLVAST